MPVVTLPELELLLDELLLWPLEGLLLDELLLWPLEGLLLDDEAGTPPPTVSETPTGRPDPVAQNPKLLEPPLAGIAAFQLTGLTVMFVPLVV